MGAILFHCGLDARFVQFAFWSTVLAVAFFVVGYVAAGFFVETYDVELLAYVGFSAFVGLLFAMKALPVSFPCALVGWCFGFSLANSLWGHRFVAALTGATLAGILASCGVVLWMNGAWVMLRPDAVVVFALPTVIASILVAVLIYRPRSETLA